MTYIIFILKSALEDFRRNKVRTFLTSLGILIGVASVVLLTAFGLGLKKYIKNQFENLGTNLLLVLPGSPVDESGGFSSQSVNTLLGTSFDEKDAAQIERLQDVEYVAPAFLKTVEFWASGKSEIGDLYATDEEIFPIRNLKAKFGEIFDKTEVRKRSKKAVMGPKIAEKLFGSPDKSIGKDITVENTSFEVIGVLEPKGGGGLGGPDFDSFVYVPYTATFSINPKKEFFTITVKVQNEGVVESVKEEINKVLSRRYDEDDFSVVEQTEILSAVTSIFSVLNMVLIAIAGISLIVGGIGIMNIMYVSVIERTREIGVRRALGATQKDILVQFLAESVVLSFVGGSLGIILSFIVVLTVQSIFPAYINLSSVVVASAVSSAVGIIFGVFPAYRASKLLPVEAIRYE